MIYLSVRLICDSHAQARAVMMALPDHIRLSRAEAGCVSFDVTPTDDPLVWQVDESFADRAAFDAHQARLAGTDWAVQTAGITRDYRVHETS